MISNIGILMCVVVVSVFIGTAIRLHILKVNNIIIYTLLIPCALLWFNIEFIIGKSIPMHKGFIGNIVQVFRRIICVISTTPLDIAVGCYIAKEIEDKYKKDSAQKYQNYKIKYRNKVNDNFRYA